MGERPTYEELEARIKELEQEHRIIQEACRESEERYQALFHRSFDIIYIHDFEGRLIDGSDVALSVLGYSKEEIPTLTLQDILLEDQLVSAYRKIQELHETGTQKYSSEYFVRCKDGSRIWLETKASVIYRNGKPYAVMGIARDISERKRVEDALRKSEEKYRNILKSMQEAYFEIDLKGRYTYFNDAASIMTGYSPEELMGLSYRAYSPPETAQRLVEVFNKIYLTGKPESLVNYDVIRKDGIVRTHELSAGLIKDESGAPVGFQTLVRDITARKEAEERLRRREERYRNILESMEEAYYEVDLKGNFTFFNTTPALKLGYAYDELMGVNFRQYMDEVNAKKVFNSFHQVFATGEPVTIDWELTDKMGQKFYVEASVSLKRDENGAPSGFKGVVRDISQRRKAEEALRISEEKYRTILQNMEESYIEVDLDGNITFFNDATINGFGYSREELMGMNNREYTRPEVAAKVYQVFHEVYESGKPMSVLDYEIIRKDGTVRSVEMTVSLLNSPSGEPSGFRCVARDVTERIKAGHALKESERLYRMLAENAHDAIWIMNLDMQYTFVSPSMFRITGYTIEEIQNLPLKDQLRPASHALAMGVLTEEMDREGRENVDPNRSRTMELEFIRKDGSIVWIDLTATFTRDMNGAIAGILGVGRDITERVKAREELTKSERRYRLLAENAKDVIWVIDLNLKHVYVSPSVQHLRGCSYQEAMDQNIEQILTPDSYKRAIETFAAELRLEESGQIHGPDWSKNIELEMYHKDGYTIWTDVSISILYDDEGKASGLLGITRDITQRKKVEKALLESEERFRTLFDRMLDGVYRSTHGGRFVDINQAMVDMFGYASKEEMMQVDIAGELYFSQEDRESQALKDFRTGKEIHCMRRKDGSAIWVEDHARYLCDDQGRILLHEGTLRDVTERVQAEKALKETHERYRTIFENTGTASLLLGEDTTILLANTNFERLSGYSKEEIEGKVSWTIFVDSQELEKMKQYHVMRRQEPGSAPESYEFRFLTRGGETRDIFLTIALIPGSKESIASCMDITERKRAEESLRISEERFRDLAELLPESVYETDIEGKFTFVNRFAYERFMYTVEDFVRGLNILDVIAPEDHDRAKANIQDIMGGHKIGLSEYTARRKDGSTFSAMVHSTVIIQNGMPVGMRGFLIDISEKKSLEDQLMRAQKMEAIGTLAGGIAHDFNNLLMGILGNVSLLMLKTDDSHPFLDRLKNIEEYVQRGSDLTKQLLGFARGGKYEVKPTDLGEFVRRSSEMFGRTKKEVRIHRKTDEGLWPVELDRGQMEQVLLNLFVNAWQAMPGGGDLYLSVENVLLDEMDVSPYDLKPGRYVKVTVTDTGSGMDEAVKTRVFEPFFTTKERGRGTGLGLASVYGIVKNHGGFIHLESEKGVGSTFMIYLPASNKMPDVEKKTSDELRKGKGTILLIDDEDMILDVGSQMLASLGYTVLTARGGKNGIDMYRDNFGEIDIVILDLIMPDVGGNVTFDRLCDINPSVKVLLSSGYSLDGQAKEIMEKGCRGFIQKPFTMEILSKRVSGILEQKQDPA